MHIFIINKVNLFSHSNPVLSKIYRDVTVKREKPSAPARNRPGEELLRSVAGMPALNGSSHSGDVKRKSADVRQTCDRDIPVKRVASHPQFVIEVNSPVVGDHHYDHELLSDAFDGNRNTAVTMHSAVNSSDMGCGDCDVVNSAVIDKTLSISSSLVSSTTCDDGDATAGSGKSGERIESDALKQLTSNPDVLQCCGDNAGQSSMSPSLRLLYQASPAAAESSDVIAHSRYFERRRSRLDSITSLAMHVPPGSALERVATSVARLNSVTSYGSFALPPNIDLYCDFSCGLFSDLPEDIGRVKDLADLPPFERPMFVIGNDEFQIIDSSPDDISPYNNNIGDDGDGLFLPLTAGPKKQLDVYIDALHNKTLDSLYTDFNGNHLKNIVCFCFILK